MVESVLHLFNIHRKVILGNATIVVQDMFCKTPKSLDTVEVVFRFLVDQCFRVIDRMMLAEPFERIIALKRVGVVDGTLPRFLPDDDREHFLFNLVILGFQKILNRASIPDALSPRRCSEGTLTPFAVELYNSARTFFERN